MRNFWDISRYLHLGCVQKRASVLNTTLALSSPRNLPSHLPIILRCWRSTGLHIFINFFILFFPFFIYVLIDNLSILSLDRLRNPGLSYCQTLLHTVYVYLTELLLSLIAIKYQNTGTDPFKEHGTIMLFFLIAILVYNISLSKMAYL